MKRIMAILLAVTAMVTSLAAQDYKVVVPQVSATAVDVYTKTIQAIMDAEGKKIDVQVLPFARCVYVMEAKQADIMSSITQIPDQAKWSALKYDYATSEFMKIVFVLYTNKNKTITAAELKAGNPKGYKIETDAAHTSHFPFALPSSNIEGSLKKVDAGMIDGYIFGQAATDNTLKKAGLTNVRREYYTTLSAVFPLQKGQRGGPIDKLITAGMAKIKANGKYDEIVGGYAKGVSNFIDWQP